MAKRMLIDATHPEETRIVVLSGNRLDQFDFESSTKKQLKGNIYLAKVTRVEPSLQAAFVDYGGNRHGFLAFNEIHPDYYQIPIADREALQAQARKDQERGADNEEPAATKAEGGEDDGAGSGDAPVDGQAVEVVSGDEVEEVEERYIHPSRRYKIQEVIKRRQIILVQVVKEERGTKGAALTTYLSLAGRYCVLMPNTARGGGISRKIVNLDDRKRLRAIANELPVADGMGVILRTAGMERSKAEIKRDFNYLVKLWANIREHTLESIAPTLIHEEANLINRALRDLYTKEIEEIMVEGDEGYRMARDFMRMLIPSHARRIKAYRESIPLYHRYQVESQLDAIHSPIVHLKSGGYIVINPTEALVAIDVNSGRATRERNIEATATKTNLEAAEEIARQLRLRDLSGLIVIDFIDMEIAKNVHTVERRIKEAMKTDRARIQMGRISHFGLLELSRQRLRPSLLEASSQVCAYCGGTGHVRSTESTSLHVLRAIEEEGILGRSNEITVYVPGAVALYVLNQKRAVLREIEERYGFGVSLASDDSLIPPDYRLERIKARPGAKDTEGAAVADGEKPSQKRRRARGRKGEESEAQPGAAADAAEDEDAEAPPVAAEAGEGEEEEKRKRRRRGKRGGRRRRRAADRAAPEAEASPDEAAAEAEVSAAPADEPAADGADAAPSEAAEEAEPKPTRRRRRKANKDESAKAAKPKGTRRTRREAADDEPLAAEPGTPLERDAEQADGQNGASPAGEPPAEEAVATVAEPEAPADAAVADGESSTEERPKQPARRGWWRRPTE